MSEDSKDQLLVMIHREWNISLCCYCPKHLFLVQWTQEESYICGVSSIIQEHGVNCNLAGMALGFGLEVSIMSHWERLKQVVWFLKIWLGNSCSLYWVHIFQPKVMQQFPSLHSWVLLLMIKSLLLSLSINYLSFFSSPLFQSVSTPSPLSLNSFIPFIIPTLSFPNLPTSLSKGNLPVV